MIEKKIKQKTTIEVTEQLELKEVYMVNVIMKNGNNLQVVKRIKMESYPTKDELEHILVDYDIKTYFCNVAKNYELVKLSPKEEVEVTPKEEIGEWLAKKDERGLFYKCSMCGGLSCIKRKSCPNCRRKMKVMV